MAQQAFAKWQLTGMQALKSACDQGIDSAKRAEEKAANPELKQLATRLAALLTDHRRVLAGYITDGGGEVDAFHDEIMDGVNRGTKLMLEAADDQQITDISLLSGSTVALNYFVVSFQNNEATSQALHLAGQPATFRRMAQEQQDLCNEFQQLGETAIYPQAAQA